MLYHDRIDVSEGIDTSKTSATKKWGISHCYYFLYKGFIFQRYACNRCYNLLMMSLNLGNISILKI